MSIMISAIGVSYTLQNSCSNITRPEPVLSSIPFISQTVTVFGASTRMVTLVTPVLTLVLVVALVMLINHTKVGMAMRAVSKDFETSRLMGIKINSVISVTFVIGSFLAAVGSILYFTNYSTVIQTSGAMPGLKAFVAAVFGGIGSVPGAVVGAFIIGICEKPPEGAGHHPHQGGAGNQNVRLHHVFGRVHFALLIIILIVKPTGLFGEKQTEKCDMMEMNKSASNPRPKKKVDRATNITIG
jgi:branched-chain amino acid transport system permease protein